MNDLSFSPAQVRSLASQLNRRSGPFPLKAFASHADAAEASKWLRDVVTSGSEGVNTAGGFVTPIETLTNAILAFRDRVGLARRFAAVFPIGSDYSTVPRRNGNGVTGYFVAENTQVTESQPNYDAIAFSPKKIVAATRASVALEEDAGSGFFADWMAAELGWALAYLEDQAAIIGDGTSTYAGILGIRARYIAGLSSFVGAVDAASGHDTFAEIDASDLAKAVGTLPTWALDRAAWYCSQPCYANVFARLAAGAGGISVVNGELTFWGLPIRISNVFATSTGDLSDVPMLYVGALSSAVYVGSRRDFKLRRSTSRYLEYDQAAYYATTRIDFVADVGDASAASGLVALMGE